MAFNPTLPVNGSAIVAAELRNQFNALNDLVTALQQQLAPLVPGLARTAGGVWTLTYGGPAVGDWQVWVRSPLDSNWSCFGEIDTSQFPAGDDLMTPGGLWWQVKICGENLDGNACTPFSNIVSYGPVPD